MWFQNAAHLDTQLLWEKKKKKKDIDRFNSPFFLCMPIEYFSIYIHTQRGVNYTVYLGMGVFTCLYVTYVPVSNVH